MVASGSGLRGFETFRGSRTLLWSKPYGSGSKPRAKEFGTKVILEGIVGPQLKGDVKHATLGNVDVPEAPSVRFSTVRAYREILIFR